MFMSKKGRQATLLEIKGHFMQLDQDEAHFSETQRKRAELHGSEWLVLVGVSMFPGTLRKVIHDSQPGSGNVDIARLQNSQRISPFPHEVMYLGLIMELLENDEDDVSVQSLPNRTLRSLRCVSPELIALFLKYGQTLRHESRMMDGAAKVVKDGSICTCLSLELVHTQMHKVNNLNFEPEFLGVNIVFGRLNSQGVVVTLPGAADENRAFAERFLRTLPMVYLLADKHADETLLDIYCEMVTQARAEGRTEAAPAGGKGIGGAASVAARRAAAGLAPPTPDSPAARTFSPSLIHDVDTPAPGGLGQRGVSTPTPCSLASPASGAPTIRAVRAASSPRAKEVEQLRGELAASHVRDREHGEQRARDQYERGRRGKLEEEVVHADVSELVLTSALNEADAQAAASLRTLEKSRAGLQFGAMQRRAKAAEAEARAEKAARLAAEVRAEVAEAAAELECNELTRTAGKLRRSLEGLTSANAALKRKRALEVGEAAQRSARLKEMERVAADDGSRVRRDRLRAEQLVREVEAATAAAASARRELEAARSKDRAHDDAQRQRAAKNFAQAPPSKRTARHKLQFGRGKLAAVLDASCKTVRAEMFAEVGREYDLLSLDEQPAPARKFIGSIVRAATVRALKAIRADIFSVDRCYRFISVAKLPLDTWDWMRQFFCRRFDGRRACRVEIMPAGEGKPALHFPLLPDSIAIKKHGEGRREADGEAVTSHDNGRSATTSYVAGCHRVLVASRAASCCAAATGTHNICYSCDAGTVASRSTTSNTWTCGGGYALLVETASSDKLSALRDSMAPILPAMTFHTRHEQLPCCERMLEMAHAACCCTASESCPTPDCEPARCPALTIARPSLCVCGDARQPMLPCQLVVTGDLANLHAMIVLGSVRTDTAHNSTHVTFDDEGVATDRTYVDAARYAHAAIGERYPGCGYVPRSAADVESERQKRIAMPSGPLRSEMLRTHKNHHFTPLIPYLEFNHYLLGVMHLGHNIFDQFLSTVFKDVDALHGDNANLIKYDVIEALRNMGTGILPPASPLAACARYRAILVYGVDEEAMLARRGNRQPSARLLAAIHSARTSVLRRACRALMLLWEKTDYDDSTAASREMHARAFEEKFTDKVIDSLYFAEGKHAVGNLIRRWGRTGPFVNEQEHMVKVTKQLYSRCSDKSTQLRSWVRRLASGEEVTVDRKTTAPMRQWGSNKWEEVEARASHDLMAELVEVVEEAMAARSSGRAGEDA
ncbi:hypothetical protein T492DRAFT_859324 [Pavlovales sp. CCMP2436]|nr:hypothetical protein T492DRAFT_859324 [Pavlovales sp. CCMP2436]